MGGAYHVGGACHVGGHTSIMGEGVGQVTRGGEGRGWNRSPGEGRGGGGTGHQGRGGEGTYHGVHREGNGFVSSCTREGLLVGQGLVLLHKHLTGLVAHIGFQHLC